MSAAFGILYAEDFDDDAPEAPPPVPEPTLHSAEALEEACRTARADAVRAARVEWEQSAAQARTQTLAEIATRLAAARQDARAVTEAAADGTVRTALAMVAGLLPALGARHGAQEVRAMLRHLLPTLSHQPRVTVRVAGEVVEAVRRDLATLDEDLARAVTLTAATLAPGDARVSWTDGRQVRDQAALQAAITDALVEIGLLDPVATPAAAASPVTRSVELAG